MPADCICGAYALHERDRIMEILTSLIGFIAATLTTIAFLPQVIKVWKSRSAKDISLGMYFLFSTGVLLWLIYGILLAAWPISSTMRASAILPVPKVSTISETGLATPMAYAICTSQRSARPAATTFLATWRAA